MCERGLWQRMLLKQLNSKTAGKLSMVKKKKKTPQKQHLNLGWKARDVEQPGESCTCLVSEGREEKKGGGHRGGKSTSSVTHWNSPPGQHWVIMTLAVVLSLKNMWHSQQTSWLIRERENLKKKTLSSHQCNGLLASMYEIWRPLCVCAWAWYVCEGTGGSVSQHSV